MASGSPPNVWDAESPPSSSVPGVKETHRISIDYNPVSGRKKLNTYEIIKELGRGEHGRVKLGYDVDKHVYVAIKLLNRKEKPRLGRPQGSFSEAKIHREIAILKKCSHPNIVRLIEVLDDESSRKIYLVLEYCAKGEIKWQNPDGSPILTTEHARLVGRNVALGLEYLHANGIIHRDIKPANLLVSEDDVVKISDFGVSYAVSSDSASSELELAKTVGTPAFFSPELCIPTEMDDSGERKLPRIGAKVDVWAFGVTLFCLLYGYLPFEADNEYELFRVIANEKLELPDPKEDEDLKLANDLLKRMLMKDPNERPTVSELKQHPWLLKNMSPEEVKQFLNQTDKEKISVSNEEVDEAVKGVNIRSRIKQGLSRIAEHIRSRSRSRSRSRLNSLSIPGFTTSNSSTSNSNSNSTSTSNSQRTASTGKSQTRPQGKTTAVAPQSAAAQGAAQGEATPPQISIKTTFSSSATSPNTSDANLPYPTELSEAGKARQSSLSINDSDSLKSDHSSDRGLLQSNIGRYSGAVSPFATQTGMHAPTSGQPPGQSQPQQTLSSHHVPRPTAIATSIPLNAATTTTTPQQVAGSSTSGSGIGLMPITVSHDTSSICSGSKAVSSDSLSLNEQSNEFVPSSYSTVSPVEPHLPELDIPRLDNDSLWGVSSSSSSGNSSSSSDDDNGELTLVIGRNRSRSVERGRHAPPPDLSSSVDLPKRPPKNP